MNSDVRVRIDNHRLMRSVAPDAAVELPREVHAERVRMTVLDTKKRRLRRVWVHVGVFVFSYLLTAGAALVGVLLWVRPDALFALVLLTVAAALIFVSVFASLRMFLLHHTFNDYPSKEEDPGMEHHVGKSIAYAFLALVLAGLLTGLLISSAAAEAVVRA